MGDAPPLDEDAPDIDSTNARVVHTVLERDILWPRWGARIGVTRATESERGSAHPDKRPTYLPTIAGANRQAPCPTYLPIPRPRSEAKKDEKSEYLPGRALWGLGRSKPDLPTYCIGCHRGEQTLYLGSGRSRNPAISSEVSWSESRRDPKELPNGSSLSAERDTLGWAGPLLAQSRACAWFLETGKNNKVCHLFETRTASAACAELRRLRECSLSFRVSSRDT